MRSDWTCFRSRYRSQEERSEISSGRQGIRLDTSVLSVAVQSILLICGVVGCHSQAVKSAPTAVPWATASTDSVAGAKIK